MSVAPIVPGDVLGYEAQVWPITVGVALPIPEPFRGELGAYRERLGDPQAHSIVAHITLVPPTEVADERHLAEILAHLQAQAAKLEPFAVTLAGVDTFRPVSQVVFVPVISGQAQVLAAEAAVRRGPLDRPLAYPFHPHVTVAHDVAEEWLDQAHEALSSYRAAFQVARLGLFVRGADGVWRQAIDFPFGEGVLDPQRYQGDSVSIGVLDPVEFPDLCDRLGEIVADSVASGAGVSFLLPFSAQDGARWWRAQAEEVATGRRVLLVARDAGEVVGTISVTAAPAPNQQHRAELSKLLVHSADRRRGVATRLMDAAANVARDRGFTLLTLDCVAGGPEEEFARALGYQSVGTIPGYALSPTGEPQDAAILYLELR